MPSVPRPTASDADSGTQIASAARAISGHGTGAGRGRTTSASQSGTTRVGHRASLPGLTALLCPERAGPTALVPASCQAGRNPPPAGCVQRA